MRNPTAGFVYKLVERADDDGSMRRVAKKSLEKAGTGGRKWAFRVLDGGVAVEERIVVSDTEPAVPDARDLTVPLVVDGVPEASFLGIDGVMAAREHHARVVAELPLMAMRLSGGDPAIPTVIA